MRIRCLRRLLAFGFGIGRSRSTMKSFSFFLLLLCGCAVVSAGSFTYTLYLTDENGDCDTFNVNRCTPCMKGNVTQYIRCQDLAYAMNCVTYSDDQCNHRVTSIPVSFKPCTGTDVCAVSMTVDSMLQMTAKSSSNISALAPRSVVSELQISANEASIISLGSELAFQTGTSSVSLVDIFNDGTYLTSAGQCAYDAWCQAGEISYMASQVPPSTLVKPALELTFWRYLLAVQSRSSEPVLVSLIEDVAAVDLDTVGDLIFITRSGNDQLVVSDIFLEDLDTEYPTVAYQTYRDGVSLGYEYTECYTSTVYVEPIHSNKTLIRCSLEEMFSDVYQRSSYAFGSFASFGSFGSFASFDDAYQVEEPVSIVHSLLWKVLQKFHFDLA